MRTAPDEALAAASIELMLAAGVLSYTLTTTWWVASSTYHEVSAVDERWSTPLARLAWAAVGTAGVAEADALAGIAAAVTTAAKAAPTPSTPRRRAGRSEITNNSRTKKRGSAQHGTIRTIWAHR